MRILIPIVLAATLVGCNEPPGAPDVAIGPEAPTTTDTLSVSFIEEAIDPNNNDEVTYTYAWTVDGQPADIDGAEVSPDLTRAGQVWSVTVTPADDKLPGPSTTATTTIENTPPTVTATIEPTAPLSTDDLNLIVVGEDVDGDTVNTSVSWTRDGGPSGISGERVPADRTRPGEVWEATVVPSDAKDTGESFTVSVQIQNQAPEVTRVILRPALPYERSVLEAVPSGTDPDGDDITFKYDWSINGVSLGLGDANTLEGDSFDKGDTVSVAVVANDGQADSPPLASETVTILNTPPTLDAVAVTPSEIYTDTPLTCTPTGFADDDGDPEQYQYQWTINGEAAATTATLDPSAFVKGDRIVCQVTPFDGTDIGRTLSTRPVAVINSLPTLASVSISPTSPPSGTTVTVTVGSTTDADGDEVTTSIDWYVDGRMVASGATLSPGAFIKGQDIYALVTPDDGEEEGTAVKSNTVTSVNSAPRILSFAMTPVPAFSADDLGVTLITDDWDGDTVSVTYTWTIDGVRYGGDSTTTVPASETSKGDVVELEVTTTDGTDDGDSDSASQTIKLKIDPPEIVIDPTNPKDTDDLYCEITEDSVDADGGTITYTFSWLKNGTSYSGTTSTTEHTGDTIPASATANNDEFTCQVYATSPNAASVTATAKALVGGLQTFSFTDGTSDDLDEDELYDWMDALTYDSKSYISFEVDDGTTRGGAWCSERADWYIDNYMRYAPSTRTTLTSGSWNKWSRSTSGSWSSATTSGRSNYFGTGCASTAYDWCSEWGIGGKSLAIMPKAVGTREGYASGWGSGSHEVTIKVAPTRKLACDF